MTCCNPGEASLTASVMACLLQTCYPFEHVLDLMQIILPRGLLSYLGETELPNHGAAQPLHQKCTRTQIILKATTYIPDKLQHELRPGFMCNSPGFQCSDNAVKSRKRIENKRA
jgi:hypothetical protein